MPLLRKLVPLDQATPGMVLADDLTDAQGNILVAEGVTLSEAMLNSLRRHRIESLSIVCGTLTTEELAAKRLRDEGRLAKLFRKPTNDVEDATGILMQYVRYYRLGGEEE
ncbi:MAG TPA: hypothetical protein VEC06_13510 [Paucimonas sp.]|nr:hypothetical protein [Paucimonas sp.]